jgi:hypothetical protein
VIETVVVLGLLFLLAGAGWAAVLLDWQTITVVGLLIALFGFALGVPTGFYYHVQLWRHLAPRGVLPKGWYWHPMRYHEHLLRHERGRVLGWSYAGGVGFVLILIGCAGTVFGLLLSR